MWRTNLAVGEEQAHADAVDSDVVADGKEIFCALGGERADQVLGHTAEPKSTDHDGGAFENILDRLFGAGEDLVHSETIVNQAASIEL